MTRSVLLIFAVVVGGVCGNINYKAKFIANIKVSGDSDLVYALSLTHCLALCNKASDCDAITFYDQLNKCRLFKRCAPMRMLNESPHYWFYAKRPPIISEGYVYDERSESCVKITNRPASYDQANDICVEERGFLAVLNTPELQLLAARMLQVSGAEEAWVNSPFHWKMYASNKVFRKKRKIIEENSRYPLLTKQCWALQHDQLVKLSVCHSEKKISICQLPTY